MIAEDKYVVMAADRTLTLSLEPMEFGHEHASKLYEIGPGFVVGAAGSPIYIPELFRHIKKNTPNSPDYVDDLSEALTAVRKLKIEQTLLRKYGWTYEIYEQYYSEGKLLEAHARRLLEEMDALHVCIHLVTGCVTPDGKASIHMVDDPGAVDCYDAVGFTATGSGEPYAIQNLIRANYTSDTVLVDAIYQVFEAKKNAEQAIGVGRKTDIRVVLNSKKNIQLTDDQVQGLGKIYERKMERQSKIQGKVLDDLKEWLPDDLKAFV